MQNLLLTFLLVGGMIGVYLYAGNQERLLSEETSTAEPAAQTAAVPEISSDGRLRDGVLSVFSDAGYVFTEQTEDKLLLGDASGETVSELLLSVQGERVNGLTLRIPMPTKPETKKSPTLIEQALLERYEKRMTTLRQALPALLAAAVTAIDPYEEVPQTARLFWQDLLLDALESEKTVSDAGEALRFRIYYSESENKPLLCLSLQMK